MVHGWRAFAKIFGASSRRMETRVAGDGRPDKSQIEALRVVGQEIKQQAERAQHTRAVSVTPVNPPNTGLGSASGSKDPGLRLAKFVTSREKVFSLGLDPEVELIAAEWFESLGYVSLHGGKHFAKGYWGGVVTETDARLGVSVCTGTSDVSLVSGYDFSNWLPLPSVVDSLVLDFPDSKFLLFETPVEQWLSRIKLKAAQARTLGVKCGCVSAAVGGAAPVSRSTSSACGDATHHTCDAYPCLWEKTFSTFEFDASVWSEAYVNHIAKVKAGVPSDRLLVVPLVGAHSPVTVARALGEFIGLTNSPDKFAATHPFEPHLMSLQSENRWSLFLFLGIGIFGVAVLVTPNPCATGVGGFKAGYSGV